MSLFVLRTFRHASAICVVLSNLKDSFRPENGINLWIFSYYYFLQLSTWNNSAIVHGWTYSILAMKLHQGPVCIDGMVNLIVIVVHTMTFKFVYIVRNQFLLRKSWCFTRTDIAKSLSGLLWNWKNLTHEWNQQYWLLHTYLTVIFVDRSKKACVNWSKEILKNYDRSVLKHVYKSWYFQMNPIQQK